MILVPIQSVGGDPLFFLKKKIYLLDVWGDIYPSRRQKNGEAYVYPLYKIGKITLKSDNTTSGVSYIKYWSYTKDFPKE